MSVDFGVSHQPPAVYAAIGKVIADLAKVGIAKDRRNQGQGAGFMFRGIDDVYNALAPLLAKHGLVIVPRMVSRSVTERASRAGGALFDVVVEAEFDFTAVQDGSFCTVRMFGEAMDSGDKATNKAMSAAYKYAALQAFCIPTEGDNDADATTHDVAAAAEPARGDVQPNGFGDWWQALEQSAPMGSAAMAAIWKQAPQGCRAFAAAMRARELAALKVTAANVEAAA